MRQLETYTEQIVAACRVLVERGYLMATGGNVSLRVPEQNGFAITPSNYDYSKMTAEDVCILDLELKALASQRAPSIESSLHATVYQTRPDVNAVVHTHQVYASALALINAPIPALFDEQARFLGRSVEIIPYAPSGTGFLPSGSRTTTTPISSRITARCALAPTWNRPSTMWKSWKSAP